VTDTDGDRVPDPNGLSATSYEEILRNIHDAVYTLDPNGVITWVNEVAIEEFDGGYSREELVGAPVSKILSTSDIEKCVELISDLVSNDPDGSRRCEIELQTANGRTIPCDLHLALLPTEGGSFTGSLGVARDITEQKHREQGLSVMNRVLRHNVRNELTIVLAGLEDHAEGDEAARDRVREAVERLLRTSDKAQNIEAVLRGDTEDEPPIDLVALAQDRVAAAEDRFPSAELSCTAERACWVPAGGALEAVIDELLENAVLHHDGERPRVEVAVDHPADADELASLLVVDDGPGIPPGELEAIDVDAETPLIHSSGLGLWLVRWVTERLGGSLRFETNDGSGTTVHVQVPTAEPPPDPE
jgi:PAS domain S-box-containing protein